MKKIGIVTILSDNFGNRLQNFALQRVLENLGYEVETLQRNKTKSKFKMRMIHIIKKCINSNDCEFRRFDRRIKWSPLFLGEDANYDTIVSRYDYFIAGSDQVWNPFFECTTNDHFLSFAKKEQKISYAASVGIEMLSDSALEFLKGMLIDFSCISVRELSAKKIIEEITGRKDVIQSLDPTLLLNSDEWLKIAKKPRNIRNKKFILNYFLGEITDEYQYAIDQVAFEHDCEMIYIKNYDDFKIGPHNFIYLEKEAFLVCTDSFHSSVFAIIFDTPFVVFNRIEKNIVSMNTRIDTLLQLLELDEQRFDKTIKNEQLHAEFSHAKKIIEREKEKSYKYLKNSLK